MEIMVCSSKGLNFEAAKVKKLEFNEPINFMGWLKAQPSNKKHIMYLFFDTETTGLPKRYDAKLEDLDNWPRMVQLAWLAYDADGNRVAGDSYIVKPQGYTIPDHVAKIHGITTAKALHEGKDLQVVLQIFHSRLQVAEILVGHNIDFDTKIVGAEFLRLNIPPVLPPRRKICTMMASTRFCNLNGPRGPKWPRLQELHVRLFGENFAEAHNAAADIEATAKCFFELKRLGVIEI